MSRQIVHTGRKIRVAVDTSTGPDGQTIRRDVILHPGAVVILPVIDRDHICLLRNFRHTVNETLWEVPAGTLEPNEPVDVAARRELLEETGYQATEWTALGQFLPSPGVMDEKFHAFVATGLIPGPAQPEIDEDLEAVTVPFADAYRWCFDGTIRDLKTIATLLMWKEKYRA